MLLTLLLATAVHGDVPAPAGEEHLLKAAFIYNFAKFTRWPESAWRRPDAELLLCTAGRDRTADALHGLAGKRVMGHPVAVRALAGEAGAAECHALYIAPAARGRYAQTLASVRALPILTVTQSPRAGRTSAIIRLFEQEGRVRFAIDIGAAREAGLELSSRLLDLAVTIVREDGR